MLLFLVLLWIGIVFLISFSVCSLQVYKNTIDFFYIDSLSYDLSELTCSFNDSPGIFYM